MTTTDEYYEPGEEWFALVDLAQCSPSSPAEHAGYDDPSAQARWLSERLKKQGHIISPGQVRKVMDAYQAWSDANPGTTIGTWRIDL